jgi:hypothetical protein
MHRKAFLLLALVAITAAGCRNTAAPREDSTIGGTLGSGYERSPAPGSTRDEASTDSTKRIGGTLGSGY